jgi:Protein of unknown function (DUF4242)
VDEGHVAGFIAECFWPGVNERDLRRLDERAAASADALSRAGAEVRYLGSILMPTDEVVLCRFEGDPDAVRNAAEQAQIPFERILEATESPRDIHRQGGNRP